MSLRAFALRMGVSHEAVRRALESGRIHALPDGTLDPDAAEAEWNANTKARAGGRPSGRAGTRNGGNGGVPDAVLVGFHTARTARETYEARIKELEFRRLSGELVEAEAVRRAAFDSARRARDLLRALPARLAPLVAHTNGVAACRRAMEREVDRVLKEVARLLGPEA